jgi:hypothetical protein
VSEIPIVAGPPPTLGPATLAKVRARLSMAESDTGEDPEIPDVVEAVNVYVRGLPIAGRSWAGDPAVWDPRFTLGADMLAARLFRRRNTPDGVAAVGDLGPVYIQRNDPDVALLLGVGSHTAPAVG